MFEKTPVDQVDQTCIDLSNQIAKKYKFSKKNGVYVRKNTGRLGRLDKYPIRQQKSISFPKKNWVYVKKNTGRLGRLDKY